MVPQRVRACINLCEGREHATLPREDDLCFSLGCGGLFAETWLAFMHGENNTLS
jgi:hypothetical protein